MQIHAERNANFEREMVLLLTQRSIVNIVCLVLFYNFFIYLAVLSQVLSIKLSTGSIG